MKKQLLVGILSIGVVGLLMGAGTFAYFTSGETVTGNTFTAGTLVVDFNPVGTTLPLTLGPAEPGVWSEQYQVNVYNRMASTMKAKYKITAAKESQTASGFWSLINVRVRHTFAGTPDPANWPIIYEGALKDMEINSLTDVIGDGGIDININHVFYYEFQLDPSAGDTYQGASCTFDLVLYATQFSNPGW